MFYINIIYVKSNLNFNMVKILTQNINGIRAILKKENIIDNKESKNNTYLNYLQKENPDIICWNELKICKEQFNKLSNNPIFQSYPYHCINLSNDKKGYAGVSIISKIKPIKTCLDIGDNSSGRYLMMEFSDFILICVYVMNGGEKLKNLEKRNEWDKLFLDKILHIQNKYKKNIIITGDLNVINRKVDTHNYEKQRNKLAGVSDIEMNNFQILLNKTKLVDSWLNFKNNKDKIKYTYFTYRFNSRKYNKGMRIDYFLLSKSLLKKIKNIEIKDNIYGSDHLPIILEIDI